MALLSLHQALRTRHGTPRKRPPYRIRLDRLLPLRTDSIHACAINSSQLLRRILRGYERIHDNRRLSCRINRQSELRRTHLALPLTMDWRTRNHHFHARARTNAEFIGWHANVQRRTKQDFRRQNQAQNLFNGPTPLDGLRLADIHPVSAPLGRPHERIRSRLPCHVNPFNRRFLNLLRLRHQLISTSPPHSSRL